MIDEALYTRVESRLNVLAPRMIQMFLDEVPFYRRLPREQLDGEILGICRDNLRVFFTTLQEDRKPTDDELAEPRASAARRAQERVPLDAVLQAYHIGGRVGWADLVAEARPEETSQLVAAADRVQLYIQCVTGAVATAYLEEKEAIAGEERDVMRALATALMAGQPAEELAARAGVDLAHRWTILALELAEHDDEKAAGVAGAIAARRKVRRVQARLDEHAGSPVLGVLDPAGGTVFLPEAGSPFEVLAGLVENLRMAAGSSVRAAAAFSETARGLDRGSAQAGDVLRLVARLGRPHGLYTLRDVLFEYQVTHPSDAVPALAALMDPLERHPDLRKTLDVYLAQDLDRRRTAAALHIHPNTLDYRLRRVVQLTGLEPTTTSGLQLLAAASVARRMSEPVAGD